MSDPHRTTRPRRGGGTSGKPRPVSDAARAWARVIEAVGTQDLCPLGLDEIARRMAVPRARVERWARREAAPSHAAERELAALVRTRLIAGEALALGLRIGSGDRVWIHPPNRRRP